VVLSSFLSYHFLNGTMFLHFWRKNGEKCSLSKKIDCSKTNIYSYWCDFHRISQLEITLHNYGKINYVRFEKSIEIYSFVPEPLTIAFLYWKVITIFSNLAKRKIFARSFKLNEEKYRVPHKKWGFWLDEAWNSSFC